MVGQRGSQAQPSNVTPGLMMPRKRRAKGEGRGEGHESAGRVKRLRRKERHAVKMLGFDD